METSTQCCVTDCRTSSGGVDGVVERCFVFDTELDTKDGLVRAESDDETDAETLWNVEALDSATAVCDK
jgi:hypothetical protein